ncbi:DNA helicase PcrA [Clostridium sp. AM58-1XD]|uniref:DNA helicase PcrA n=1 Tax=Clostridium sp. AM58-1XD TaxID=2292307 RepID=UPI000E555CA6|nr:DNA helicase PcrA [Clostridium sp. AM58-1XD]RGY96370.1 DNA helicase PcrA [Clostridium sp. AM58-1XD]
MSIYDSLNPCQKEAVLCTEGPLLVLAGAGSGKTRVLTHRIAYLIDEKGVNPWNILAITFTNKAAGEMRERVDKLVEFGAESIWVSTFHSSCVRILRRHIESLGYSTDFTIYDSDDQKTLMKHVFKALNVDSKTLKERTVLGEISSAKDEMISPEEFELNAGGDYRQKKIAQIYKEYQRQLKKNNALDFDDLIVKTVELLRTNEEVRGYYQERFKYIMVDEYQDTNYAQFCLVSLLAGKYRNLCVVGDDDQSIYKFRGADIENILNFEKLFPGAKVIKLEQNYRSTENILNAANEVIRHNRGRKDKTLWTANGEGERIRFCQFNQAYEEAEAIVKDIQEKGYSYKDTAVLYRTNAQSRILEEKFVAYSVPYRMVGGVNFYQRKEIKDILAYLKVVANGQDDLSVLRVINVPKRGIGATSVGKVTAYASEYGFSMYDAFARAKAVPSLGKAADKILVFVNQIEDFREKMKSGDYAIRDLIEDVLHSTGYQKELEDEGEIEAQTRLENIEELINKAVSYENNSDSPSLGEFLEEVALVADVDRMDDSEDRVTLMTLHSAKGLEFDNVYLSGMEDGLFPSMMSIMSDDREAVEEERRLCYVGITRAKKHLLMTGARQRMINGETRYSKMSRFIEEIPPEMLDAESLEPALASWKSGGSKQQEGGLKQSGSSGGWNRAGGFGSMGMAAQGGFGQKTAGFGKTANAYASGTSSFSSSPSSFSAGKNPGFGKVFDVQKAKSLDYGEGDRVHHIKFGDGTVKSVKDGGRDFEVTVDFDQAGVKKMFASFAKLRKL